MAYVLGMSENADVGGVTVPTIAFRMESGFGHLSTLAVMLTQCLTKWMSVVYWYRLYFHS